jgi:hypothetical protein
VIPSQEVEAEDAEEAEEALEEAEDKIIRRGIY